MKKNVIHINKAKKISITKRNNKEFGNISKDGINVESNRNKLIKHSSYKEISLFLNNNIKKNFKLKSKEKKKANMSKDYIDENKKILGSPIKSNKRKFSETEDKNSNLKSFEQKLNRINKNNRFNNNIRYIPKQKKKILICNINSGLNSNYNLYTNSNNNINNNENIYLSNSTRTNEEKKIAQAEILELQLINSRFKNEIQILIEKNKSLNEILDIKNKDIEILKNKNNQLYNETNVELDILKKKYENDIIKQKKNYDKSISIIKSLINITIELCETIINGNNYNYKNIKPKMSGLDNNSISDNSLDIYECNNTFSNQDIINFNKDEEKKYNLLKQIKEIIIEKINFITKELNLILDSSFIEKIEHIRSWNFQQIKSFPTFSFLMSNIKRSNTNNNSINNISINDDFDFSVSKSFYNHSQDGSISPKFNNSSLKSNVKQFRVSNTNNKMPINISNESKNLFSSLNEISNNNKENENKINLVSNAPRKIFNILEYSLVDLNEGEEKIMNKNNDNDNKGKNKIKNSDDNDKINEEKNENFVLNSLSFNNDLISDKKENDNNNFIEDTKISFDKEYKNQNFFINLNTENKAENNLNNFTLKNI